MTERPTLPKGWEWELPHYAIRNFRGAFSSIRQDFGKHWAWHVVGAGVMASGTAPDASSAAAAAERAVVEWARGLIREVEG